MNKSTSKGCLLIQNSYQTSGWKSAKDKELVCGSDRTFLTSYHESAQDLESGCLRDKAKKLLFNLFRFRTVVSPHAHLYI